MNTAVYNPNTDSYIYPDKTVVPAMTVDTTQSLLDILHICILRKDQKSEKQNDKITR